MLIRLMVHLVILTFTLALPPVQLHTTAHCSLQVAACPVCVYYLISQTLYIANLIKGLKFRLPENQSRLLALCKSFWEKEEHEWDDWPVWSEVICPAILTLSLWCHEGKSTQSYIDLESKWVWNKQLTCCTLDDYIIEIWYPGGKDFELLNRFLVV